MNNEYASRVADLLSRHLMVKQLPFARATGIQQSYLSAFLKGRRELTRGMIDRIAAAYPQVNLHWLLTGAGEPLIQAPAGGQGGVVELYRTDRQINAHLSRNVALLATHWNIYAEAVVALILPGRIAASTMQAYAAGSQQLPLRALLNLELLTGVPAGTWCHRYIERDELPPGPLSNSDTDNLVRLKAWLRAAQRVDIHELTNL